MNLHDYQEAAAAWMSRRRRCLVVSPAGSGKTIIAAAALCRVISGKRRSAVVNVGWVANTVEQCQQAQSALERFPTMTPLVSVKIACAAADTDWSDRQVLIVDEAHHATAPQWRTQIGTCRGALWGMTATPETGRSERDDALVELFGGELFTIGRESVAARLSPARVMLLDETDAGLCELMNREIERRFIQRQRWWKREERSALIPIAQGKGKVTTGDAAQALARLADIDGELRAMVSWQVCIDLGIVGNRRRNNAAIALAIRHREDMVLMLVNQIEHGAELASRIPGATLCYSKMGKSKRRAALDAFRDGRSRCIIATSLADEGLDLPMANVLILVSGGRSRAKTEQRTGRVLRRFAGKSGAMIYDFEDLQHPLMTKHARARQALYRELGYEVVTPGAGYDTCPRQVTC